MLVVLISCVGCDQATKHIVRTRFPESITYSLWGDLVRLQHTQNHGAFLSLGATFSEHARFVVFVVAVAFALAGMVAYLIRKASITSFDIVAISLILGGGVGNLIDRILFNGEVTDFLNLGIGQVRTGIFNIADVAIMMGAGMLLYQGFRSKSRIPGHD